MLEIVTGGRSPEAAEKDMTPSILILGSLGVAALVQTGPTAWRLPVTPLVSIGSRDAEGPALFGKVAGAVRQGSGAIVVADRLNQELRVFSATGDFLRTIGRFGAGPGEFRTIAAIRRCAGDSTFVYDVSLRRLSVFSPSGTYARAVDLGTWSAEGMPPYDLWCNAKGMVAALHRSSEPPAGPGPRRPQVQVTISSPDGALVHLGYVPASERYFFGSEDIARPLGKLTSVALGSDRVYVGTGDTFEVRALSFRGESLGVVREDRKPVTVAPADVTRYIEELNARLSGPAALDRTTRERILRSFQYPKTFPAYGRLLVDPGDNLWVEDFPIPGATERGWSIFSKDGHAIGRLRVPVNFEILETGLEYVLGVWRDEFNVEYVRVYTLVKK